MVELDLSMMTLKRLKVFGHRIIRINISRFGISTLTKSSLNLLVMTIGKILEWPVEVLLIIQLETYWYQQVLAQTICSSLASAPSKSKTKNLKIL
jgi:hypothetical protein